MQQYSGTPGVKSNFRDYPGKSGRVGRFSLVLLSDGSDSDSEIVMPVTKKAKPRYSGSRPPPFRERISASLLHN